MLLSFAIQTFLGEYYGMNFSTSFCIFIGYFSCISGSMVFWSFVNQAFYRLCRIVHSQYRWLQSFFLYILLPLIEFVIISILLCPILILHDIIYLIDEFYCYLSLDSIYSVCLTFLVMYGISASLLSSIYFRIIVHLRKNSNNQTLIVRKRQQRDVFVVRRIFLIIGLLIIAGMPATVLLLMKYITGKQHPLLFRITWFSNNLSIIQLNISILLLTPQLKRIIFEKMQHNQIHPMRHNTT
ncbi:hypothetical protein I4U23_022591 [Adineta vaga]|nr:hypothetical protein I4U23_022591 [Adineta vaga]